MYLAEDRVRDSLTIYCRINCSQWAFLPPQKKILRFCAGSSCLNVVGRGSCTMSSRHTPLPMYPTRSVYISLTAPCIVHVTHPPTHPQVPELISQRRRWLNGSFFAAVHSTVHFHYLYRSSHTFIRKAWIHVEMVYQIFNLIFSWFALVRSPSPFF